MSFVRGVQRSIDLSKLHYVGRCKLYDDERWTRSQYVYSSQSSGEIKHYNIIRRQEIQCITKLFALSKRRKSRKKVYNLIVYKAL